ncbi:MAG: diguanylate cyclase [Lachnospiraceae bacterium]|nr:diguanylate cyclase [Lachnospiraceae bacterium]
MKQIQFVFKDEESFDEDLRRIRQWSDSHLYSTLLFHLFTGKKDQEKIEYICGRIKKSLPESLFAGCSAFGSIIYGDFSDADIVLSCTLFEYETSKVEILQYSLSPEALKDVAEALVKEVDDRKWVKGIEMLSTIRGLSMTELCDGLSKVREDVEIFGGGALADDINATETCVFSSVGGYSEHGIIFILLGGEDLHMDVSFITGWKPLGSYLNVTAAEGSILKELNNKPAYETYYKYLHIENNEDFFLNTLEFPFFYHYNGIDIMRAPVSSNPDGSLVMTSDMESGVKARIAYGDPWTILDATQDKARELLPFVPECIFIFSCAGRRTFWGDNEAGKETLAYQQVAPTSGFYTSGEFMRTGRNLNQHNVTQVIAALREGIPKLADRKTIGIQHKGFRGRVSIINRMATFIKATTEELEELNQQLSDMARTDALTGLFNRGEIQRRITEEITEENEKDIYLIMLDLDHFKRVNDVYGHGEGDRVLAVTASILKPEAGILSEDSASGRWGGEEFMVMTQAEGKDEAVALAEKVRERIASNRFEVVGNVSASLGVTRIEPEESADAALIRVDKALYEAKEGGRNRVVYKEAEK